MFSVSVSVVLLVFFVSQAICQSVTTSPPTNSSNSTNSTVNATILATTTELPTTTSVQPTTTPPKKTIGQSTTTVSPSPPSIVVPSSSVSISTTERTCANLSVVIEEESRNVSNTFSSALRTLYSGSVKYTNVEVSEVHFTEKEDNLSASAKLCLVFKGEDDDFIEDVFKKQVKNGKLGAKLKVKKDSAEFEPLGVSFKDWKAKEGECEDKCDGAAGPFYIVKECEPDKYSCDGHKEPTDETDDCTKYCDSSTVAATVSSVMIGIILSFSFQ